MQNNNEELIYEDIINEEHAENYLLHLLGMYSHKEDNNENISTYWTISNNI